MEWVALNGAYSRHALVAVAVTAALVFDSTSTSFMGSSPSVAPNIHVLPLNYTWINQKSVHLAAQTAIDYVMSWVFDVFPTKSVLERRFQADPVHRRSRLSPDLPLDHQVRLPPTPSRLCPQILHLRSEPHFTHFVAFDLAKCLILVCGTTKGSIVCAMSVSVGFTRNRKKSLHL
ncbi:hypothetical protein OG21DRAFT_300528 [Imleria badia]|nr:hypothetical protein OG21DRAFT_300528 [Imleria badia]